MIDIRRASFYYEGEEDRLSKNASDADDKYRKVRGPLLAFVQTNLVNALGGPENTLKYLNLMGTILCRSRVAPATSSIPGFQLIQAASLKEAIEKFVILVQLRQERCTALNNILQTILTVSPVLLAIKVMHAKETQSRYTTQIAALAAPLEQKIREQYDVVEKSSQNVEALISLAEPTTCATSIRRSHNKQSEVASGAITASSICVAA